MQKANRAGSMAMHSHRLIDKTEMKQWRDPHCPSDKMLESGQCWVSNEIVSLENRKHKPH